MIRRALPAEDLVACPVSGVLHGAADGIHQFFPHLCIAEATAICKNHGGDLRPLFPA